jgi:hypothetical protein
VAADEFDERLGLCLAAAALLDKCPDSRFDDARHTAIGKTLG